MDESRPEPLPASLVLLTALLAFAILAAGIAATVVTLHGAGDRIGGILASVIVALAVFVATVLCISTVRESRRGRSNPMR